MTSDEILLKVELFSPEGVERDANQDAWGMESTIAVDPEAARLISRSTAERWQVLPFRIQGQVLLVATADCGSQRAFSAVTRSTGLRVRPVQADLASLQAAIFKMYGREGLDQREPLGQLLLGAHLITQKQLDLALQSQLRTHERLGRVLVSKGFINRLALAEVLAIQEKIPMINLRTTRLDPDIARLLEDKLARKWQCLPIRWVGGQLLVALVDPMDEKIKASIYEYLKVPLIFAVTSEFDIDWALDRIYRASYLEESIAGLLYRNPEESAFQTFTDGQLFGLLMVLVVVLAGFLLFPMQTLVLLNALIGVFYLSTSLYRFWLANRSRRQSMTIQVTPEEIAALKDSELPVYTVMIPVFREVEVLPQLFKAIQALDYPKEKLDVKLLFEETDTQTLDAARSLHPPGYIQFIIVPDAVPRTKPKALNYGLVTARGPLTVIYDAEDTPEPDQLKRAVVAFRKASPDVVCLQAKLNYYNAHQNLLTRWFTIEYSVWFDLVMPGMDSINVPIPLGGTSNHFYTEKLRELGAWDPFNVTEDADLGIRMYRRNYRTAMIDSTTFEEATSDLWNWVRQRTRWEKGYMQTWLVSMRHPVRLYRSLGFKAFISFQLTIGGAPFLLLINPIYWAITTLWFIGKWTVIPDLFPGFVFYLSLFNMLSGNIMFIYLNLLGTYRRKYYDLSRYAILSPLYWLLISAATWRSVWQLLTRPSYWEKTIHGAHFNPWRGGLSRMLIADRHVEGEK